MSPKEYSSEEIDKLRFEALRARGIASVWATHNEPRAAIVRECNLLLQDADFRLQLNEYLRLNPVIIESIDSVLSQLAFASGSDWRQVQPLLHGLARRGASLSRWLPTFLLVDGPLGRLLKQSTSPLAAVLKKGHSSYPLLANSRDAFNNDLFRKVRNGFAHWSFVWRSQAGIEHIQIFHYETGAMEAEISILEAEALHDLSASIIEALDRQLLRRVQDFGA